MKQNHHTLQTAKRRSFVVLGVIVGFVLAIPAIAMQFTEEVVWSVSDFVIMATLLYLSGSLAILLARKYPTRKMLIGVLIALFVLWLWAELAVGVFTNWGS